MKNTKNLQNFRLDSIDVLSPRRSYLYCRPCGHPFPKYWKHQELRISSFHHMLLFLALLMF